MQRKKVRDIKINFIVINCLSAVTQAGSRKNPENIQQIPVFEALQPFEFPFPTKLKLKVEN